MYRQNNADDDVFPWLLVKEEKSSEIKLIQSLLKLDHLTVDDHIMIMDTSSLLSPNMVQNCISNTIEGNTMCS